MFASMPTRTRSPTISPPVWIKPELAALVKAAPEGTDWLHEMKLDGYRMHARLDAGHVQILTRRGNDWTQKYPSVAKDIATLPARNAYLDGELCGVGPDGRTAFNLIQNSMEHGDASLVFFLFDLLFLDGEDVTGLPLIERKAKLEKNAVRRQRLLDKCEGYCRELRQVLRQQEDLQAHARDMYELDHAKDQLMTLFKVGLANLGMWVRDQYFSESYQHCGWQRLWPFFKLGGWITTTASEVQVEFCAFNNRALVRDLEEICRKVNISGAFLPDGRRLVVAAGKRLRTHTLNGPQGVCLFW